MKSNVLQNTDDRWAKSSENSPGGVEGDLLREILRRLSGWSSGVHPERGCQGSVRSAARVAVALGSLCILVAFWAYPAHAWWRTVSWVSAYAVTPDAAGDVVAVGEISGDFTVGRFSGATGEELWRQEVHGTGDGGAARAVAVDGSGDVIAAGYLDNSGTYSDFTVIKFSGATGEELWRQQIDGTDSSDDSAGAVAVDDSGDVIAAGSLYNTGTYRDFTVIKFSGATGEELWRQEIDETGSDRDYARTVAVDGSGDVIAAGSLYNSTTGVYRVVIKFSGATGEELWRHHPVFSQAAVAIDGEGDVIAAGSIYGSSDLDFAVGKFSGATGEELWRKEIDGIRTADYDHDQARAVAVDSSGDVIAAGTLVFPGGLYEACEKFAVIKFSGATGDQLWRKEIKGNWPASSYEQPDANAFDVAVDASGDVIAGGDIWNLKNQAVGKYFMVIKFSGATGAELWRREIFGGAAHAVAVDASGDVIAAGDTKTPVPGDGSWDWDLADVVVKFSGATGQFGGTHKGKSLLFKDDASDPKRRQFKLLSKDPDWRVPLQGSADDPTLVGASVWLANPYSGEQAAFDLPPGPNWRVTSTAKGVVKYAYKDPSATNGPCVRLLAISGKRVYALCKGRREPIPFTLDEYRQEELVVSVQFGGAEPQCAWFGFAGPVTKDRRAAPRGIFKAYNAQVYAATCPAPPSPSAAFIDVTSGVLD